MKADQYLPVVAGLLCFSCASLFGKERVPGPDPMPLVENERAFAAAVAEKGVREGFLEFLARDAVSLVPEATCGYDYYEALEPTPMQVVWQPSFAEIAASGDLGYTTGPCEWRASKDAALPLLSGHYVTIWRKQEGGGWKVALDTGVSHDPNPDLATDTELWSNSPSASPEDPTGSRKSLVKAEAALSLDAGQHGVMAAYLDWIAPDVRVCRDGEFPARGAAGLAERIGDGNAKWTWLPTFAAVSSDGGLGYAYGEGSPDGEHQFSYLRIWRWGEDGRWRIAFDLHLPLSAGE